MWRRLEHDVVRPQRAVLQRDGLHCDRPAVGDVLGPSIFLRDGSELRLSRRGRSLNVSLRPRRLWNPSVWVLRPMRSVLTLAVAACFACGSSRSTLNDASDEPETSLPDAPMFSFDAGDAVVPDAALADVFVALTDGGGLFQCDNSTCDGRTQYCNTSSVGPPGPATCTALPDGCVPANCECLPNANLGVGCSCSHATTGDGLVAGCALP